MSLQYHAEKSETWVVWRGVIWGLIVIGGAVCTRLMRAGDVQNLETGCIHRLMVERADAQVLEPSTPDRHAADQTVPKDVVRLHCVLGRAVSPPRSAGEAAIVQTAIEFTEEAIASIEAGQLPKEHNLDVLIRNGAVSIAS